MQDSATREKILKKIRKSLIHHRSQPFPNLDWDSNIHVRKPGSLEEIFATEFSAIGGRFLFCESEIDFLEQLVKVTEENSLRKIYAWEDPICALLDEAAFPYTRNEETFPEGMAAITSCESLVARLGNIIVSSKSQSGRRLVVVPTVHIVMAYTSQLCYDIKDALAMIRQKYGDQLPSFLASPAGPSRTADIEKTLVTPAHGPRDLFVFLIDDTPGA